MVKISLMVGETPPPLMKNSLIVFHFFFTTSDYTNFSQQNLSFKFYTLDCNNTIKAGGSTKRAQNVGVDGWSGWTGYPLDCYDY